jgi:hypothetical protein
MMFGDGSVRYVGDVVDPQVLKLLGNRADGQLIDLKDLER